MRYIDILSEAMMRIDGLGLSISGTRIEPTIHIFDPRYEKFSVGLVHLRDLGEGYWIVDDIHAVSGYGPLLYAVAATFVSDKDGILIPSVMRSPDARAVWMKFDQNPYVRVVTDKKSPTGFGIVGNGTLDLAPAIAIGAQLLADRT